MAELILTDAEKAAASYLDWDDAALGKFTKHVALTLARLQADDEGLRKVTASACGMMLIGMVYDCNAATLKLELEGHTHSGVETGDWTITVKRKGSKPNGRDAAGGSGRSPRARSRSDAPPSSDSSPVVRGAVTR